jgi:hypothetical protein
VAAAARRRGRTPRAASALSERCDDRSAARLVGMARAGASRGTRRGPKSDFVQLPGRVVSSLRDGLRSGPARKMSGLAGLLRHCRERQRRHKGRRRSGAAPRGAVRNAQKTRIGWESRKVVPYAVSHETSVGETIVLMLAHGSSPARSHAVAASVQSLKPPTGVSYLALVFMVSCCVGRVVDAGTWPASRLIRRNRVRPASRQSTARSALVSLRCTRCRERPK